MSDISFAQQLTMNNWEMNSQILQGAFSTISGISNSQNTSKTNNIANLTVTNSLGKLAYAVEGDSKYDKAIDSNEDGIITYNEYVKYITESRLSKYNLTDSSNNSVTYNLSKDSQTGLLKFSVTNMKKVMTSYLNNYVQLPTSLIENEA